MCEHETPRWAKVSESTQTQGLSDLLSYARHNYASHTDWYLRHRETGIKTIGVIIAATFTVGSLSFDKELDAHLASLALGILAVLSIVMPALAIRSCHQAYRASLESALLATKAIWAMGLAGKIGVPSDVLLSERPPAVGDRYLYVTRYIKDASRSRTTKSFVRESMTKCGTTYFATKWTLLLLGMVGATMAVGLLSVIV